MCKKRLAHLLYAKKNLLFLFFITTSLISLAQMKITVSGKVTGDNNTPLSGASVKVKNAAGGTTSDNEGRFSLQVDKNDILVFSYVDFDDKEITADKDNSDLSVQLTPKTASLSDVVVIGYGTSKKKDLTGAVASINMTKIAEVPLTSVDQIMTGRASGVQINQSNGQAGAGTSIRIRGGNSLNGTNEPLFVIDGFPIINDNAAYAAGGPLGLTNSQSGNPYQGNPNGALNFVNPADIQSIEVLKDASATAIYGSRGANGVIIITTKKGRSGQARVNFNASYGISELNDSKIELMNGSEYAAYHNQAQLEQGKPQFYVDTTIDGRLYPRPEKIGEGTNWVDEISRKGAVQSYSLDFSGGKEVLYSGSVAWASQETPLIGSQFKRSNFRLNVVTNITPWLTFDNTASFSQSIADNSPADVRDIQKYGLWDAGLVTNPAEPAYNADGSLNYVGLVDPLGPPRIGFNPIASATDVINRNTIQTFLNNLSLKARIIKDLNFELRGSVFTNDLLRDIYYNSKTTFNGYMVGGLGGKNSNNSDSYLVEAFGNYNKTFGKNLFTALLGYSYQTTTYRTINSGASKFPNDNLKNENLASGGTQYPTQTNRIEDLLSSYFVRLNNVFNEKYMFTFTARYDGSSKFAEGNKWALFPSGAISWRISQEDFLKNAKTLSDLKLRVSYGLSGNQAIASLQTKSTIGFNQYPYGGVIQTGVFPEVLGNTDLTWETTKQFNAGIDFGFWNQRLSGSFNYYVKNTEDLLQYLPLPANSGYTTQLSNVGTISNNGVELELRAAILDKSAFRWDINANIAANKQKMTDLGRGGMDTLLMRFDVVGGAPAYIALITDQPIGLFYGYVTDGLFRSDADLAAGPALSGSKVGTRRFKDLNKDGVINDKDRKVIGDPNPDFVFGISNYFSYKGFDLNFLIQGSIGAEMWNLAEYIQRRLGNLPKSQNDYFTPTNTDAVYFAPAQHVGLELHNDFSVGDASYVRLKSLNLGYNFNLKSLKYLRSVRLYFSGTNLFTITPYDGYDPEVNSFAQSNLFRNIDILSIPLYRTYTFGINVGF